MNKNQKKNQDSLDTNTIDENKQKESDKLKATENKDILVAGDKNLVLKPISKKGFESKPKIKLNKENLNSLDTNEAIKVVADKIIKRIQEKGHKITKSRYQDDGDYYIEFNKDTTSNQKKIKREYYSIDKSSIEVGDLNKDKKLDFALESLCSPLRGNIYGLEWHIFLQKNGEWDEVENEFLGGKFGDIESVLSIDDHIIKTEFREYNEKTSQHVDSTVIRSYKLENKRLERIE